MANNPLSTLQSIRTKVRRLTRSASQNILSDSQIDEYVNTFLLYDFPEYLKLFNLNTTFEFFTQPFQDVYTVNTTDPTSPLYNFTQRFLTVEPPVYIAGYQTAFMESRQQFFGVYPMLNSISSIGITGDGVTTTFSGVINTQQSNVPPNLNQNLCLLRDNVLFDSIDVNGNALTLIDYPISVEIGALGVPGIPQTSLPATGGQINYLTGAFTINFPTAPAAGQFINSQTVLMQPSRPQTMLFFDGEFTLRPVPDQSYRVQMDVFARPSELLSGGQAPKLEEWWQWIAIGASKKIFEDRLDMESVQQILPMFREQQLLVLRRTIEQQSSQRAPTIYSQGNNSAGIYGAGWFSGGN